MSIFTREPPLLDALDKEKLSNQERQHREQLADISRKNQRDAAEARAKLAAAEDARSEGARRDDERRHQQAENQQQAQRTWAARRDELRAAVDAPISDEEIDAVLRRYAGEVIRDERRAVLETHIARAPR